MNLFVRITGVVEMVIIIVAGITFRTRLDDDDSYQSLPIWSPKYSTLNGYAPAPVVTFAGIETAPFWSVVADPRMFHSLVVGS